MDHSSHSSAAAPVSASNTSSSSSSSSSHAMTMHMTFYGGQKAVILFDEWATTKWGYYLLSLAALFALAFWYQYLQAVLGRVSRRCARPPFAGSLSIRALQSALFTLAVAVAYLLMLAVMTFNAGIFVAVTLGFGFGFFFFHSSSKSSSDSSSCDAVPATGAASSSTLTPKLDPTCCP